MEFELKSGEKIELPEIGETDEHKTIFNGGSMVYVQKNGKWTCPVCGQYTLVYPWCNCICNDCDWVDDGFQCLNPDVSFGENDVSLVQAKELWEKYHEAITKHKDKWRLTFGVPEIDNWIQENAGKITEDDLIGKMREVLGGDEDGSEEESEKE